MKFLLIAIFTVWSTLTEVRAADDPLAWLARIAAAAEQLDYSGTFTYQAGGDSETSRIVHLVDAQGERERLEVLDGSPREVIRSRNEVKCVLPEQKTVIIDRPGNHRSFPARLPSSIASLAEHYEIRMGEHGRVAGHDARQLLLEPRDDLRYGHQLWAEVESGLLLKARMVDEHGAAVEQFSFNEVQIGGVIDPQRLQPRYVKAPDWRVVQAHGRSLPAEESGWVLATQLPGFEPQSAVLRQLGPERGEALQLMLSDGLAAISVFIEPLGEESTPTGHFVAGSINIYKRIVAAHLVTVLGEVPARALALVGDGVQAP